MTNENQPQLPAPVIQEVKAVRLWPLWFIIIILVAFLVAVTVYGGSQLQQIEQLKLQIAHIEQDDDSQNQGLNQLEARLEQRITKVESQSRSQSSQLTTHDRQINHNSVQLAQVGGQSRTDWLLAEAEYLLRLANQRLNIEKDFAGAEAILKAADSVMAESDDPGLYTVRQQLAKDILALQRVSQVDREGIYLQLEALIDLASKLDQKYYLDQEKETFAPELTTSKQAEPQASEDGINSVMQKMLNELKQLIVIRRLDEPVEPLLAPEQIYYLKQNLRLMLEQAELALLDRNQQMYERSLRKAEAWIQTYFLQNRQDTDLLLSTLASLKEKQVNPKLPDISQSLQLLKDRVALLYRQHPLPSQATTQKQTGGKGNAPSPIKEGDEAP